MLIINNRVKVEQYTTDYKTKIMLALFSMILCAVNSVTYQTMQKNFYSTLYNAKSNFYLIYLQPLFLDFGYMIANVVRVAPHYATVVLTASKQLIT